MWKVEFNYHQTHLKLRRLEIHNSLTCTNIIQGHFFLTEEVNVYNYPEEFCSCSMRIDTSILLSLTYIYIYIHLVK